MYSGDIIILAQTQFLDPLQTGRCPLPTSCLDDQRRQTHAHPETYEGDEGYLCERGGGGRNPVVECAHRPFLQNYAAALARALTALYQRAILVQASGVGNPTALAKSIAHCAVISAAV